MARRAKTENEFVTELGEKNPSVQYVTGFSRMKMKAIFRCKECGYEWVAVPHNLLHGHGCPKCAQARKVQSKTMTAEDFAKRISSMYDGYEVVSAYEGLSNPVTVRCSHGHLHTMMASTFLHKRHLGLCPECNVEIVRDVLDEETLRYEYLDEGLTVSQICERHHRSQRYVSDSLKRYGIETKPRRCASIEEATLRQMYLADKLPIRDICDYFGCSEKTLYNYIKRYDIPKRRD